MTVTRLVASGTATVLGLAMLGYASAFPLPWHARDGAQLRLSWSARPERIEVCRAVSAEEQAQREEHMRQRVVCDGVFATYALRVEVDGHSIEESVVRGAGLRHDRPLYLLRDFAIPSGEHRLLVRLTRREKTDDDAAAIAVAAVPDADTGLYAGRAQREDSERARRVRAAIPKVLSLDTVVAITAQRVALVTFDIKRRELNLHAVAPTR